MLKPLPKSSLQPPNSLTRAILSKIGRSASETGARCANSALLRPRSFAIIQLNDDQRRVSEGDSLIVTPNEAHLLETGRMGTDFEVRKVFLRSISRATAGDNLNLKKVSFF